MLRSSSRSWRPREKPNRKQRNRRRRPQVMGPSVFCLKNETYYVAPHQIISMCTEERKKAKQSYKESLQNVATVRQQAAVSHFTSFMLPPGWGGLNSVSIVLDNPVGRVKNPRKSWHILPRDWQILLKIC